MASDKLTPIEASDRLLHEPDPDDDRKCARCRHCGIGFLQPGDPQECPVRLRAALDAATREMDEALARPAYTLERGMELAEACHEDGVRNERERIVEWLRASADARHSIESGEYMLSPAGRGLGLLWADAIERGEHTKGDDRD